MRGLVVLVGVLSVLLVVGAVAVVATLLTRPGGHAHAHAIGGQTPPTVLDEPAGTRIVGAASVSGNLALVLQGGGPDRVLVLDGVSGSEVGRVALAR